MQITQELNLNLGERQHQQLTRALSVHYDLCNMMFVPATCVALCTITSQSRGLDAIILPAVYISYYVSSGINDLLQMYSCILVWPLQVTDLWLAFNLVAKLAEMTQKRFSRYSFVKGDFVHNNELPRSNFQMRHTFWLVLQVHIGDRTIISYSTLIFVDAFRL